MTRGAASGLASLQKPHCIAISLMGSGLRDYWKAQLALFTPHPTALVAKCVCRKRLHESSATYKRYSIILFVYILHTLQ